MSDNLESFIRNNREQFDRQQPRPELWDKIQTGLSAEAAAGTASSAATAKTASGLAKIATAWKIAAVSLAVTVASVATYVIINTSNGGETGKDGPAQASTQQVEPDRDASPLVQPPLPEADLPYTSFNIDGLKGGELSLPNGSLLRVPPSAFLNAQGESVTGNVEIRYREFHDAADIILSGIPMHYDNQGKKETFESAGMVEILGYQAGQPVTIAPNKEVEIEMASFVSEDNYNLYFLDPQTRAWDDIGKAKLQANPRKSAPKPALPAYASDTTPTEEGLKLTQGNPKPPRKPVDPKKAAKNGEIGFDVAYEEFPELKPFKKIRWVAADPEFLKANQWIFTQVWNEIKLEEVPGEQMAYNFVLKNTKKKKSFTLPALPVLEARDYDKALQDFREKKAKYDRLYVQKQEEAKRLAIQADFIRVFNVSSFGVFNCDRFYRDPDAITVRAEFEFGDENFMDPSNTLVFHVLSDRSVRTLENGAHSQALSFSPKYNQHLLAVLPDGTLAEFGPKDFQKIEKDDDNTVYTFKMRATGKAIRDASDLRELLNI